MTLDQAKALRYGQEVHFTGRVACTRTVGPRGGVKVTQIAARVNGEVKVWKRSPGRVQVPVKRGLYDHGYINEGNLWEWHLAEECPVDGRP